MAFNSAFGAGSRAGAGRAQYNLPHGVCNAILLPVSRTLTVERRRAFCPHRTGDGRGTRGMSDEAASQEAINAIRTLSKRVGIQERFQHVGRHKKKISSWLDKALADPTYCNPRTAEATMKFASCARRRYDPQSLCDAGKCDAHEVSASSPTQSGGAGSRIKISRRASLRVYRSRSGRNLLFATVEIESEALERRCQHRRLPALVGYMRDVMPAVRITARSAQAKGVLR